jgi:DNA polymerase-1
MSRKSDALAVNLEREEVNSQEVLARLKEKKKAAQTVKRRQNKIQMAIDAARRLVQSGTLVNDGHQVCVMDKRQLKAYAELIKQNGIYCLDLETTGLDVFHDKIVGVCLYTPNPDKKRLYVPVNHTDIENNRIPGQLTEVDVLEVLGDVFDSCRFVNHTNKFDGKFVKYHLGKNLKHYWDVWLGAKMLNENEDTHELKPLYAKYVERRKEWRDADSFADLFGKTIPFNYMPIDVATIYGADDAYKAYSVMEFQRQFLDENSSKPDLRAIAKIFHKLEMPLIPVLIDMELTGVKIDKDYAKILEDEMTADLNRVEDALNEFVQRFAAEIESNSELSRLAGVRKGEPIKLGFGSPKQLSIFLFDILKCPVTKSGKKKKKKDGSIVEDDGRGTGEDVILKLMDFRADYRPFFENLLKYRELDKLLGTYVIKLPKEVCDITNRLHGSFNQYGADTGRFSSSDPNLQNIPSHEKRVRRIFKAEDGNVLISADYSQIEPRVLAYVSNDVAMKAAYAAGRDLYSDMASKIFNKPYEECGDGSDERKRVKAILLGIMYEKSPETIAKEFKQKSSWGIKLVNDFYDSYPLIKLFKTKTIHQAETLGYVQTVEGRKRRLPEMMGDKESKWYNIAFRKVVNAVIQGTSADITKRAMLYVAHDKRLRELGYKMLLTVHDELIGECPRENAKEAALRKKELMIQAAQEVLRGMPIKVDFEITERWYGEKLNDEILAA